MKIKNNKIEVDNLDQKNSDELLELFERNDFNFKVVDLKNLKKIGTAGLRCLLFLKKMNKHLKFENMSTNIKEMADIVGFGKILC